MDARYEVLNTISGIRTAYDRYDHAKHRAGCMGDAIVFDVYSNNRVVAVAHAVKEHPASVNEVIYITEISSGGTITQHMGTTTQHMRGCAEQSEITTGQTAEHVRRSL